MYDTLYTYTHIYIYIYYMYVYVSRSKLLPFTVTKAIKIKGYSWRQEIPITPVSSSAENLVLDRNRLPARNSLQSYT